MPVSRAIVPTSRAQRYLAQLCSHTDHLDATTMHRESDRAARITLGAARCDLTADPSALALVVEADDSAAHDRLQAAVTRTLERIGRRDGLAVIWNT